MTRFQKIATGVLCLAIVAIAIFFFFGRTNPQGSVFDSSASTGSDGYQPSNERIDPYEVMKNPFKLKGHSGIFDTAHVSVLMPTGQRAFIPYPGGCLRFEKMIDAHTATYAVMVGEGDVHEDGEIAVLLSDSNPPDSTRPWRVLVEDQIDGTNGIGADLKISAVRFEGYYSPPSQPAVVSSTPETSTQVSNVTVTTWPAETVAQQMAYSSSSRWVPASHTAESITGPLSFSTSSILMYHQIFTWYLEPPLSGTDLENAAKMFSVEPVQGMVGFIFQTNGIPADFKLVNDNTLCGGSSPSWAVALIADENLNLAFFSGDVMPNLNPAALSSSNQLCGTFSYTKVGN